MEKEKLPTAEEAFEKTARELGYITWPDLKNAFCMDPFGLNDRIYKAANNYKELHTAPLQTRIDELEAWKESMSKVIKDVDLQECGKLLNIGLGQDIAGNIVPKIKELKEENEKAFKELYRLTDLAFKYQQALEVIARNPQWLSKNLVREAKEALKGE